MQLWFCQSCAAKCTVIAPNFANLFVRQRLWIVQDWRQICLAAVFAKMCLGVYLRCFFSKSQVMLAGPHCALKFQGEAKVFLISLTAACAHEKKSNLLNAMLFEHCSFAWPCHSTALRFHTYSKTCEKCCCQTSIAPENFTTFSSF